MAVAHKRKGVSTICPSSIPSTMLRWCVNVHVWNPSLAEFERCLRCLPAVERESCHAFRHRIDQKRALVSRLLQRRAVHEVTGIPYREIEIGRTHGKKPYLSNTRPSHGAPNFNFNVAHEGYFVVLASEAVCLCGVDISAPQAIRRSHRSMREQSFIRKIFTPYELECMREAAETDAEFDMFFQRHWALKEAFVKARGDGIAFGLRNAEFDFGKDLWSDQPRLRIHGVLQDKWTFTLHPLADAHWVAVAKGPPEAAMDRVGEFKATFQKPSLSSEELMREMEREEPAFQSMSVEQLLPDVLCQTAVSPLTEHSSPAVSDSW